MKLHARVSLLLVLTALLTAACNRDESQTPSTTESTAPAASSASQPAGAAPDDKAAAVSGSWTSELVYVNPYFGLTVTLPEGWFIKKGNDEERNKSAAEFLSGDNQALKGALQNAINKTITVFWAYQYPPGTPGKTNANLSMTIENVRHLPGIKSPADYLAVLENTLRMTNKEFVFDTAAAQTKLGELDAWSRDSHITLGQFNIKQRFYVVMKEQIVLLVGATFVTPEDEALLGKILSEFKHQ